MHCKFQQECTLLARQTHLPRDRVGVIHSGESTTCKPDSHNTQKVHFSFDSRLLCYTLLCFVDVWEDLGTIPKHNTTS